jgi:hypothetical protein
LHFDKIFVSIAHDGYCDMAPKVFTVILQDLIIGSQSCACLSNVDALCQSACAFHH